jgi:hypothetical protein
MASSFLLIAVMIWRPGVVHLAFLGASESSRSAACAHARRGIPCRAVAVGSVRRRRNFFVFGSMMINFLRQPEVLGVTFERAGKLPSLY